MSRRPVTMRDKLAGTALFLIISVVSFLIGTVKVMKINNLRNSCTKSATAVAVNVETKVVRGKHRHEEYRATLAVPAEMGVEGNMVQTEWSGINYRENEHVAINYDPKDPSRIYISNHPPYDDGKAGIFVGVIFLVFGVGYLVFCPTRR